MTDYVAGFLFSMDCTEVALIQKNKPRWQRGKLNGIGGKIELGEHPREAMKREFTEEAGVEIGGWRKFCVLRARDGTVHFFMAFGKMDEVIQMEEEAIWTCKITELPVLNVVDNLRWLIPMALDNKELTATVQESLPFGGW